MTCGTTTPPATPDGSAAAPFILKKGRTFLLVTTVTLNGSTVDLLSPARTGRAQLRRLPTDLGTPVATFTVTIRNPQTGSSRGRADVRLGADVSATGAAPAIVPGDYVMDVEFVNDVDASDVIASDVMHVRVVPEVTQ